MKPIGSRDLFVRDDEPGAAAAPAGPELTARRAHTGSAPARNHTLAVLAAAGAAAAGALWAGTAQPAAAAALTVGRNGLQSAGLASAPGPSAATTDATSLQGGLFLPSELLIPTDPCLPPSLI